MCRSMSNIGGWAANTALCVILISASPVGAQTTTSSQSAAGTSTAAATASNKFVGSYQLFESNIPVLADGTMTLTRNGDYYTAAFDFANGQRWQGVAVRRTIDGKDELWLAAGPSNSVSLGIYQFADGEMKGEWIPLAAVGKGPEMLGKERLLGPADYKGSYRVVSGTFAMRAGSYTGMLTLTPFKPESDLTAPNPRLLSWSAGGRTLGGIGMVVHDPEGGETLAAASTADKTFFIARVTERTADCLNLDFCGNTRDSGYMLAQKKP